MTQRKAVALPRVGLGWTCPPPLLLEVAPEIDTNPTSFYRGRGRGVAPPPDPRYRLALAMSVHPAYFDLAMPLAEREYFCQMITHIFLSYF